MTATKNTGVPEGAIASRSHLRSFTNSSCSAKSVGQCHLAFDLLALVLGGRRPSGLPCEPLCLQALAVVRKRLLSDLVLGHCLFGINLTECLTRFALSFADRFRLLKFARRLCHFFAFSPISTSRRMASGRLGGSFCFVRPLPSEGASTMSDIRKSHLWAGTLRAASFFCYRILTSAYITCTEKQAEGKRNFRPGSNPSHKDTFQ